MKKLRNKKTGEIGEFFCSGDPYMGEITLGVEFENEETVKYNSFSKMAEEWEDYEEPKDSIEYIGLKMEDYNHTTVEIQYQTKEEAEKAVEKLKAWKRLKDNGFKFDGLQKELKDTKFDIAPATIKFNKGGDFKWFLENKGDLFLLFGGEE